MICTAAMLLKRIIPARRRVLDLPLLEGARKRVMVATSIIITPMIILILISLYRQYELVEALHAKGDTTAAREPLLFIAATLALTVFFAAMAISLSVLVVERRLLNPMRHLTDAAYQLAEGKLATRVDMDRVQMKEMRTLGSTLNAMAGILENLALTDSLTAIANRRQFDQVVAGEVKRSSRMKKGLALLLIDVDKFKNYNDLYGHGGGDLCLRRIAQTLRNSVHRPSDLVARYGGEEFAVLLPDTDEEGARVIATELLDAVRTMNLTHGGWEKGIVTISIGVAVSYPPALTDPTMLIERADQALYIAKQAGRDRVVVSNSMTRAA